MASSLMRMTEHATGPLYDLWALFYDYSFGALVRQRQRRAVEQLRARPGDRVLDMGVGTGMTLRHYPRDITIIGLDLSNGMLTKAARKIKQHDLPHCQLAQGDAMRPPFADHSFDHVMITHVISVVSDPEILLHWAQRLVKPGGRIVILNHFLSTNPLIAWFEHILNPMFIKIGWRSNLPLEECLKGVDLNVQYRFKIAAVDLWQIVVLAEGAAPQSNTTVSLPRAAEGPIPGTISGAVPGAIPGGSGGRGGVSVYLHHFGPTDD